MRHQRAELPLKLDGLGAARDFFAGCLADASGGMANDSGGMANDSGGMANEFGGMANEFGGMESVWVAHLDDQARCLHVSRHPGDVAGADLPIRQILSDAIQHHSAGIVLAHNHPSGDARPSGEDCRATRRLATAAEAIDCVIVDHLVFGGTDCSSFRQMGLL